MRGEVIREGADLGKIYHRLQQLGPGGEDDVLREVRQEQQRLMTRIDAGEDLDGTIFRKMNLLTELFNKARVMAHLFWDTYPTPEYLKDVGRELKVVAKIPGHDFPLEGTIDRLVRNDGDGSYWIRDHKSTSGSLEAIFDGFEWSIQARMYRILANAWLAENVEGSPKVRGFILDAILKPGIKQCRTDEKNAIAWNLSVEAAYLRRVREWYKEKGLEAIQSKALIFAELEYPTELKLAILELEEEAAVPIRPELFPRDITRRECRHYERQCEYYSLCKTSPGQWDSLFEHTYKFEKTNNEDTVEEDIV